MRTMKKLTALLLSAVLVLSLAGCGGKDTNNGKTMADAQVTLGNYKNIPVTIDSPEVSETDVDDYIDALLYYYSLSAQSERTQIMDGDTVMAELYLYDKDGELLDDGAGHEGFVYIGSGQTYPELEAGLIGKETGQEYEIPITLPDPYEFDETLSGQTITAKVTPEYIQEDVELSPGTLTDEQASMLMGADYTAESLRSEVRAMLMEENADSARRQAYSDICAYLLENCKVEPFPDMELEVRADKSMEQTKELCGNYYGITFEEYLEQLDTTEEEYRADIETSLSDTIRLELIFTAIGDAEDIQYDASAFDSYISEILQQYTYETADELYEEYGEDYIKRAYRIEYIVDWLIDQADMSYTVLKDGEQPVAPVDNDPVPEPEPEDGADKGAAEGALDKQKSKEAGAVKGAAGSALKNGNSSGEPGAAKGPAEGALKNGSETPGAATGAAEGAVPSE